MELTLLTSTFIKELDGFAYTLSSTDRVWNILFPDQQEKWHHLHINQYQQTYYIKRGGNTTHINLTVTRPSYQREDFKIELRGEAISRMVETMNMFLAIHTADLPISIANPEDVRKRLLAQDNIGIVPRYASLHRANQHFGKHQDVFDVMHYDDLGRFKRRITPFITWEALPILKPRDASDILLS